MHIETTRKNGVLHSTLHVRMPSKITRQYRRQIQRMIRARKWSHVQSEADRCGVPLKRFLSLVLNSGQRQAAPEEHPAIIDEVEDLAPEAILKAVEIATQGRSIPRQVLTQAVASLSVAKL